jgi:hypothetical protein
MGVCSGQSRPTDAGRGGLGSAWMDLSPTGEAGLPTFGLYIRPLERAEVKHAFAPLQSTPYPSHNEV